MRHVEHAMFPRLDALSEVVWSPAAARNWNNFLSRLPAQFERYADQGVSYADSAFAPSIQTNDNVALKRGKATITLSDQAGYGAIHYTVDGSAPDLHAPVYSAPFTVNVPATIKAATFADDGSMLAAPRTRVLDRANLLSREGVVLPNCPGSDFRLRIQPMPDATSMTPVYAVNVFDTCQQFPAAPLDGVTTIRADVVRLERNYALAHEAKLVVSRPHSTPHGEFVVHMDSCDGPIVNEHPVARSCHQRAAFLAPCNAPRTTRRAHTVSSIHGTHRWATLCDWACVVGDIQAVMLRCAESA